MSDFMLTLAALIVAMVLIIGMVYLASVAAKKDRLRKSGINFWTVVATCSIATFVVTMGAFWLKKDESYALGVLFGLMSLLLAFVFRFERFFSKRRIGIVAKSRSNFVCLLREAARQGLSTTKAFTIEESTADTKHAMDESMEQQVKLLRSPEIRALDALIVIPASSDEMIAVELAVLISRGVYVVCCDIKPDNRHFFERGLFPPAFVGSDAATGGRLIGEAMCTNGADDEYFIVLSGPCASATGRTRTQGVLAALRQSANITSIHEIQIPSWNPEEVLNTFRSTIKPILEIDQPRSIYCANDEICRKLSGELLSNKAIYGTRWSLYGYDGVTDASGTLILSEHQYVKATVDQKAAELGATAARFVEEHYRRIDNQKRRRTIIKPELICF